MSKCENCRLRKESAKAFDIHWHDEVDCPYDKCPVPNFPKTNADRIRSMSDEELAEVISSLGNCDTCYLYHRGCSMKISCKDAVLDWLKQDAKNA